MWALVKAPTIRRSYPCKLSSDANGLVVVRRQLKLRYVPAFFEKLPP
jgi:hypothetical protein